MFSIIIPTWNNLCYLKWCVEGIRSNSAFPHQILVHVNDGSDGTLGWVELQNIDHTHSTQNIGICKAVNKVSEKATSEYIVFMNDDMYPLPGWDTALLQEIKNCPSDLFMFSSTMIEPYQTGNKCVIVSDFGRDSDSFDRLGLLSNFTTLPKEDWSGSCWPPNIVHIKWWRKVGGYSDEFSPGMSSDDDFAMKMWQQGCRIFKGVHKSRVYHFVSKSTGIIDRTDGRKQFLKKWGIKQSMFHRYYLQRGERYRGVLQEPRKTLGYWWNKILAKVIVRFS